MKSQSWRNDVALKRHPRSKHVRLKVLPPGRVEVVVPLRFDERELPHILDEHASWVEKNLSRLGERTPAIISPPNVLRLEALDEVWQVSYRTPTGQRNSCRERLGRVLVIGADSPEAQRQLLKRWLSRRAKRELVPRLKQMSAELALPYRGVTIRCQRTRWGSCSARGDINLNYALLFLQPDLVRYLFVHELCHTVHLNHSARYWALVERHEPHFKVMEKALKSASREVPGWLHHPFTK